MDYEKLYKKAKAFGIRMGLGGESEDFAQECLIQAFKSGPIKLKYVFLNYRDSLRADKRVLSAPEGQFSNFRLRSLDAPVDGSQDDSPQLSDYVGSVDRELQSIGETSLVDFVLRGSKGRKRDIAIGLIQGNTNKEIAEGIGLSESRVSQLAKEIRELILILFITPEEARAWVVKHAL